jgi:TetR/AcrR family transcriptional repressor of nem operon
MKVSREQVVENRRNILDAAARLFKEQGFDSVTLVAVMKEAGLTHGGFYGHFQSKDDLIVQACAYAVAADEIGEAGTLHEVFTNYLSATHRDNRAVGCPFAALGSEAVRQSIDARNELTEGLKCMIDRLSELAPGDSDAKRRVAAISSFSAMMGGLVLSRLVGDPVLSDELLAANRQSLAMLDGARATNQRRRRPAK